MKTYLRLEHRHLDVACDLDEDGMQTRGAEWQALREGSGLGTEAIPGGARIWLGADAVERAQEIVGREAQCCGFLDFEIIADGDGIRLDITSPASEGAHVAAYLAGLDHGDR